MIFTNNLLAVIGIIGGLLCATADCLLDIKGPDNQKLGKGKVLDSKWMTMANWRFKASDIIAMFAVPMYTCGFLALMNEIRVDHEFLATIMKMLFCCGAMGGFMIHSLLCISPRQFREIMKTTNDLDLAERVVNGALKQIAVPFSVLYTLLVIVPAIVVMVAIAVGIIPLPMWCMLLNPLVFQIIGLLLRATKCKLFIDAPSICAASLGLAMYGVLALML